MCVCPCQLQFICLLTWRRPFELDVSIIKFHITTTTAAAAAHAHMRSYFNVQTYSIRSLNTLQISVIECAVINPTNGQVIDMMTCVSLSPSPYLSLCVFANVWKMKIILLFQCGLWNSQEKTMQLSLTNDPTNHFLGIQTSLLVFIVFQLTNQFTY